MRLLICLLCVCRQTAAAGRTSAILSRLGDGGGTDHFKAASLSLPTRGRITVACQLGAGPSPARHLERGATGRHIDLKLAKRGSL